MNFLYFSFLQGVFAFLAPCAIALLPGYIIAFISKKQSNHHSRLFRGLKLATLSLLGILAVYLMAGIFIVLASELIKEYMKWVALAMGIVVILLGIVMLAGKNISFSWHFNQTSKSETLEAILFGIAYAIGALGCLFPLFLVVSVQAIAAPPLIGLSYFLAYFLGMATLMMLTMILSVYAQDFLQKSLNKILPYIGRASGVLLIIAGIYIIRYQLVLF